jgi:hypothetical protein
MATAPGQQQQHQQYYSAPSGSISSFSNNDGTRTPSPQGPFGNTSMMGSGSGDVEVPPSPVPASISSTGSSEPSHSQHGSNPNFHKSASTPSVPNPFTSGPPLAPGPASGWGSHAHETGAPHPYPAPPQHYPHPHHHHYAPHPGVPMVVSAPVARSPAPVPSAFHAHHHHPWARENSCPNFSIGTSEPKSPANNRKGASTNANGRRRYNKATSGNSESSGGSGTTRSENTNSRRQKRLERNRESARLSRRRRKQYLEILEDRVTQLSTEVDQGRRAHAAQAVSITVHKRREVLEAPNKTDEERVRLLEYGLGRTSSEMMLVTTFKYQQLKSFSLPPESKFILWLTLQNDQYFRGGRAASERLSAARIGERVSLFIMHTSSLKCWDTIQFWFGLVQCHEISLLTCLYACVFRCLTAATTECPLLSPCGPSFAMKLGYRTTKKSAFATFRELCFNLPNRGWNAIRPVLPIWPWNPFTTAPKQCPCAWARGNDRCSRFLHLLRK